MAKSFVKHHHAGHHSKKAGVKKGEPHETKLEREDVQWPHKHTASRTRKPKRAHEHNRHLPRKHSNW